MVSLFIVQVHITWNDWAIIARLSFGTPNRSECPGQGGAAALVVVSGLISKLADKEVELACVPEDLIGKLQPLTEVGVAGELRIVRAGPRA